jgi:phospholipid/cholesterol/gamma-HCH transport system substrate-binding protein
MTAHRRHLGREIAFLIGATVLGVAFFLWLMILSGGIASPTSSHYEIDAVLPSAGAQLVAGARVTMAGVDVGTVSSVSRRGDGAVVAMDLTDGRVTPLPAGSRVQLRERTPLGEDYISILSGTSRQTVLSGSTIPESQVAGSVDVDQVLSTLRGSARGGTRHLIQSVGGAVDGRGAEVNALVGGTAATLQSGSDLISAVYGERDQMSALIDNLGQLAAGLGERGAEIESLARGGLTTFSAIAARDAALRSLLRILPPALSQVRQTTAKLSSATGVVAPVLANLADTLRAARPAARALAPAAATLQDVLASAGAASTPLQATLGRLVELAPPAMVALPRLRQTLCQLNPMVRYMRPYTPDVLSLIEEFASSTNGYDAISHTVRLTATINDDAIVGLPPSVNTAVQTLLHSGVLGESNRLSFDPYPGPGQAAGAAGATTVTGPSDVRPATGYVYPHVTPRCDVPTN